MNRGEGPPSAMRHPRSGTGGCSAQGSGGHERPSEPVSSNPGGEPSALAVRGHVLRISLGEQAKYLAGLGVPTRRMFGVERLAVDGDVEDALGAGREREGLDDVLIPPEDV